MLFKVPFNINLPISLFYTWESKRNIWEKFWELQMPYFKIRYHVPQETNQPTENQKDTKTEITFFEQYLM